MKTNVELIKRFHCAVVDDNTPLYTEREVNEVAILHGFYVLPGACTEDVFKFVKNNGLVVDHTFYKSFGDVLKHDRFELFLDQVAHYASTYGTGFTEAPYVVNDGDTEETKYQRLTVIYPVNDCEMYDRCLYLLSSGIALSKETLEPVCDYVVEYANSHDLKLDYALGNINNKEAKCLLCMKAGVCPTDPVELLRLLQYSATGSTLLIKDYATLNARRLMCSMLLTLTEYQIRSLSTIFNRFKPIFLMFKNGKSQSLIINKISRYSKVYHQPFKQPFWADVTSYVHDMGEVRKRIYDITAFKAVAIIQSLREQALRNNTRLYVVRNGKVSIQNVGGKEVNNELAMYHMELMQVLFNKVVDVVKSNTGDVDKKTYRMPKNVSLGVPASERTFIGNYPLGTQVKCEKNTYAGICWGNNAGWRDIDLHFYDIEGNHYGWSSDYYKNKDGKPLVIFSGDMTSPVNGSATEVMYFRSDIPDGVFVSSNYDYRDTTNKSVKSSVFIATDGEEVVDSSHFKHGYMVDKKDIVFSGDIVTNNKNSIIGFFEGGTFTVANMQFNTNAKGIIEAMRSKAHSFMSLEAVLDAAGFTREEDDSAVAGLDFSNVEKDDIIKLLSHHIENY